MSKRKTKSAFFYTDRVQRSNVRSIRRNPPKITGKRRSLNGLQQKVDIADIYFRKVCRHSNIGKFSSIIGEAPNREIAKSNYIKHIEIINECNKLHNKLKKLKNMSANEERWLYKLSRKIRSYNKLLKLDAN